MKKLILIFVLFTLHTAYSQWEITNWKNFDQTNNIWTSKNTVITDGAYMISTDNGDTWNSYEDAFENNKNGIRSLAINDSIIYVGTLFQDFYVSEDYGKSWEVRNSGFSNYPYFESLVVLGDKLFAGTYSNGILMSTDKGFTWIEKNKGLPLSIINSFATIGNNIFASVGFEYLIYLSTDFGDSWSLKKTGFDSIANFNQFAVIDNNIFTTSYDYNDIRGGFRTICLSTDMGNTWIERNKSILKRSGPSTIAAIDGRLFIGTNDSLFYSDDLGETWVTISLTTGTYRGAEYLTANEDMIYASSGTELFKSSDKGDTWIPVRNELNYGTVNSITSHQDRLYACTLGWENYTTYTDCLYYSTDNGVTWVRMGFERSSAYTVFFKDKYMFVSTYYGLYRSEDKGATWKLLDEDIYAFSSVIDGENIFIPFGSGYYKSTDNGDSWKYEDDRFFNDRYSLRMFGGDDFMLACIDSNVYISFDKGENWEDRSNGLPKYDLQVEDIEIIDGTIFLGTTYGIFVSTDSGLSWQARNEGLPTRQYNEIEVVSLVKTGKTLFAGVRFGGVYYTTDNGLNWIDTKCDIIRNPLISSLEIHGDYIFFGTDAFFIDSKKGDAIYRAKLSDFGITDVKENYRASQLSIYPNPVEDFITIQLSNKGLKSFVATEKVQIFDLLGIEIISESIHPMTGSHRMNVERLPAGVYFIRIGDKVEKFVKK